MLTEKTKRFVLEVLFWCAILTLFGVFFSQYYLSHQVKEKIHDADISSGWAIYDSNHNLLINNVTLPADLRRNKSIGKTRSWILEKNFPKENFLNYTNPIFVAGRIGDADQVYINNCLIGSTGYDDLNQLKGWFWGKLRYYEINKQCVVPANNRIQIKIEKIGGPNYGVFGGPIGIGEKNEVFKQLRALDYLRFDILVLFGVISILIGIYYFFIYLLISQRENYGLFSLLSISLGLYELVLSSSFYRLFDANVLVMKINFLSACLVATFTILFLNKKFEVLSKKFWVTFVVINIIFTLVGVSINKFDNVYKVYENWFTVFILYYIIYFVKFILNQKKFKDRDLWRYRLGMVIFFVSCIHDVVITVTGIDYPYFVPYGFVILLFTATLSLAKEYADAFLYVEAQVGERTRDLSGALEQLRGLEKMKERFFANVSHDLKTPITIALGAIEETKNKFALVIGKFLDPADRSLRRLQDMVLGILDTVKAESGTLQLNWKSVKVTDFLENIVEPYKSLTSREGIKLSFSPKGYEGLYVPMDAQKIERVIENLLSNAVKFTKRTPRPEKVIQISLRTDQSKLYIYIDDSGIGIPETEREMVFERYFQSSRTDLREHGGSGIGLSFVKEMVSLHSGSVYVEESPFNGTRFTIELPLSQNIENIQSYRIQDVSAQQLRGSLDVEYPPTVPGEINPAWSTILVAEDNPEVAQIIYSALKDHYNVYFAENGRRALQIMQEQSLDCVVSDIEMPEVRGDELVQSIRAETKTKSIPILMLSSHGDDDTVVKLLKLGANDYIAKPFRREILLSRINAQITAYKGTMWNTKLEKLQELGQLVSGIGHQGKNRISRIGSNFPLLIKISKELAKKLEAVNPEEGKRLYEKVSALGDLIGKGYEQTLGLFKAIDRYASGSDKKTVISIEEIINDTLTLLEEKIRTKNATVEVQGVHGLAFEGYNEIREAILNIISNSVDALAATDGQIMIEGSDKGKEILISVRDNGSGILKDNLPHVFEPFFTSKKIGEGTGLGLYLARDAVELKNQGKLSITSPGKGLGATVHIRLPKLVPDVQHTRPTMHNVDV